MSRGSLEDRSELLTRLSVFVESVRWIRKARCVEIRARHVDRDRVEGDIVCASRRALLRRIGEHRLWLSAWEQQREIKLRRARIGPRYRRCHERRGRRIHRR